MSLRINGFNIKSLYYNGSIIKRACINGLEFFFNSGIITDDLVLWLNGEDFSNDPTTTSWKDRSGYSNDVTAHNFAYTENSGSDSNGAVAFDGIDDYCDLGKPLIPASGEFTITIQGTILRTGISQEIVSQYESTGTGRLHFGITMENAVQLRVGTSEIYVLGIVSINEKLTFTITRDSNNLCKLYKNNIEVGSKTITLDIHQINFMIGKLSVGTQFNKFAYKHIIVYNKCLSVEKITQNYNTLN